MTKTKTAVTFILCAILSLSMIIVPIAIINATEITDVSEPQEKPIEESTMMTTSQDGIDFIKSREGFSKRPYYDYGQYSVGYGTRCPADKYDEYKANGITEEEAEALLREHLNYFENEINKNLIEKYDLTLTQGQFDALASFTYNIGQSWITKQSCLIRDKILANAPAGEIVRAFSLYCNAGGEILPSLVNRRLCEANMYLNSVYSSTVNSDYGYVYLDPNGGEIEHKIQGYILSETPTIAENPTFEGKEFIGWYTIDGKQVFDNKLYAELNKQTIYVKWDGEDVDDSTMDPVEITVTGVDVNVRSGPGTNFKRVSVVTKGDMLTVTEIKSGTGYIWGCTEKGWVALKYTNYETVCNDKENDTDSIDPEIPEATPEETTPSDDPATEENPPASNEPQTPEQEIVPTTPAPLQPITGKINVNEYLRIREKAGTTHAIVGYLKPNDIVVITETEMVGSVQWGKISSGWISMDYVIVLSDTTDNDSTQEDENKEDVDIQTPTTICGVIKADCLRIRKQPGTSNAIVGYYYNKQEVVITETQMIDSVKWGKTNKGWISMDYVIVAESDSSSNAVLKKTIKADCLRIRSDAGTTYKIVGYYYQNTKVTILETKKAADGSLWGKTDKGWISMQYTK